MSDVDGPEVVEKCKMMNAVKVTFAKQSGVEKKE